MSAVRYRAWRIEADGKRVALRPGGRRVFGPRALAWLKRRAHRRGYRMQIRRVVPKRSRVGQMIELAEQFARVGIREDGPNRGASVERFQNATSVPGTGWPWCMAFVVYCAITAGIDLPYRGAYVPSFEAWARKAGRWRSTPRRGYAVVFDFGGDGLADHVGIVVEAGQSADVTIEGNTSSGDTGSQSNGDGVYRRVRPHSQIKGYVDLRGLPKRKGS